MALFGIGKKKQERKPARKGAPAKRADTAGRIGALDAVGGLHFPRLWALCDKYADPDQYIRPVLLYKTLIRLEEGALGEDHRAAALFEGEPAATAPATGQPEDPLGFLLNEVAEGERETLRKLFRAGKARAGAVLYSEGAAGDYVYLVRKGRLTLSITAPDGRAQLDTVTLGPGEVFGEEVLLGHPSRPATAVAVEEVSLLRAEAAPLTVLFPDNPGLKHLFERVRERRVAEAIALVLGKENG